MEIYKDLNNPDNQQFENSLIANFQKLILRKGKLLKERLIK